MQISTAMRVAIVLSFLAIPFHWARAETKRDPLAVWVSHRPRPGAIAYLGSCYMPVMPDVADPRRADKSDPRGVAGLMWRRVFMEGAVSGVAIRPTDSRAMSLTLGFVTWF